MKNTIYKKKHWEFASKNKPEWYILDRYSPDDFWNTKLLIPEVTNKQIILDLGCGIGRIAKWISPKEYWGVDFSAGMIEKAKERFKDSKNINFVTNNGKDLSVLEDDFFDVAYTCLVYQHITKEVMKKYTEEVHRVLKESGVFHAFHIPKKEEYVNGLTEEEVKEMFKAFKKLTFDKRDGKDYLSKYYFNVRGMK